MCYILCMCVCVGTSDMTTASDDPSSSIFCVVCIGRFPRGVPGGEGMPPPGYVQRSATGSSPGQHPEICFGRFLLFLAVL
jgi:hypothetical protein